MDVSSYIQMLTCRYAQNHSPHTTHHDFILKCKSHREKEEGTKESKEENTQRKLKATK